MLNASFAPIQDASQIASERRGRKQNTMNHDYNHKTLGKLCNLAKDESVKLACEGMQGKLRGANPVRCMERIIESVLPIIENLPAKLVGELLATHIAVSEFSDVVRAFNESRAQDKPSMPDSLVNAIIAEIQGAISGEVKVKIVDLNQHHTPTPDRHDNGEQHSQAI